MPHKKQTSNGLAPIKHPTGAALPLRKQAEKEPKNIFSENLINGC